jgi:regulator of nonsense transcripts 2
MPMDIEFIIQDTFSATRPLWKLPPNLDEAAKAFAEAVSQNYKIEDTEKTADLEDSDVDSSDEGADDEEVPIPEAEEDVHSSGEEVEVCLLLPYDLLGTSMLTPM